MLVQTGISPEKLKGEEKAAILTIYLYLGERRAVIAIRY